MRATKKPPAEPAGYPSYLSRDVALLDGRSVFVRAVLPSDITELRRVVGEADVASLRSRYLGGRPPRSDQEFERLVTVDYHRRLAVVALSPQKHGVGIARYEAGSDADVAEVAVAVDPQWRNVGLATLLVRVLAASAMSNGIHRFQADFFATNQDVQDLFAQTGLPYQATAAAAGVVTAEVTLSVGGSEL